MRPAIVTRVPTFCSESVRCRYAPRVNVLQDVLSGSCVLTPLLLIAASGDGAAAECLRYHNLFRVDQLDHSLPPLEGHAGMNQYVVALLQKSTEAGCRHFEMPSDTPVRQRREAPREHFSVWQCHFAGTAACYEVNRF